MDELLHVEDLKMHFGGLKAIDGLTPSVYAEEVLGIIGPNEAGKAALFNVICGVYKPTGGKVFLRGAEVQGLSAHEMTRKGIARTLQTSRPLKSPTTLDDMVAAAGIHEYTGVRPYFRENRTPEVMERAESVLELVGLGELRNKKARDVSLDYLRRLGTARVLITDPLPIALDKPTADLPSFAINQITELVLQLKEQRKTAVLIEYNPPIMIEVYDRIAVLSYGKKVTRDIPAQIQGDPQMIEAHLGEEGDRRWK